MILEALRGLFRPSPLYIDLRRINDEDRRARYDADQHADPEYRAKIKRRMIEGLTAEQMPPLYRGSTRPASRAKNVSPFRRLAE